MKAAVLHKFRPGSKYEDFPNTEKTARFLSR